MLLATRSRAVISVDRLLRLGAQTVLVWVSLIAILYLSSAIDTLGESGFIGARAARDEVFIVLAAAAFSLSATAFVAAADGRVAPAFLVALFVVVAGEFAITSHRIVDSLVAVLLLGLAWSAGDTLLRLIGLSASATGRFAFAALATGLGIGALSFAMLFFALTGDLTDLSLAFVLVLAALTLVPRLQKAVAPPTGTEEVVRGLDFAELTALTALFAMALVGFAVCLTPQTGFDALHYHLAMPRFFLEEQGFVERPDIIQSYFPLGLEIANVPAFRLGGEATANLLHWAFAPLTAVLLWSAGDRIFGRPAGAVGAALFGLMPLVVWESTAATSDLSLTFFIVAAVYIIAAAKPEMTPRIALITGIFAGLALSFKIVAALYLAPIALVFLLALLLKGRQSRTVAIGLRPLAGFVLGGLLTGSPWLVLRWVQTGNPVLPLFNDIFRSHLWPPVHERFDLDQFGVGTSATDFLSFWWEASVNPGRFGQMTADWLIGLPLLASLGALLVLPSLMKKPSGRVWLLAAGLCLLSWFVFSQYLRYGLPAYALLAPVAAAGIAEAIRRLTAPPAATSGLLAVFVSIAFGAGVIVSLGSLSLTPGHFPTDVLLGRETAAKYRRDWVPNYNAISFFDRQTKGSREQGVILGFPYNYFASNRLYDVIVPATLSPFRRIVEAGLRPEEMARALIQEDVRWFIYDSNNPFQHEVWPPQWLAQTVLSPAFIADHMEVTFSENGVFVYRIVEDLSP